MCDQVAKMYIEKLSPNAEKTISQLRNEGWEMVIISGGFTQVIEPVAAQLGIDQIFAVDLFFDSQGNYQSFDKQSLTARNGGKPNIIQSFKNDNSSLITVMIGDGISDLETNTVVNLFVGYGGVITREAVQAQATAFIVNFNELPQAIQSYL